MLMEANASGDTRKNRIRTRFEYFRILDHYLKIQNLENFYKIFPISSPAIEYTSIDIPFLLAQKALSTDLEIKQLWGQNLLYDLLQNKRQASRIAKVFHYSYLDFSREVASHDIFKIAGGQVEQSVYQKTINDKDSSQEPRDIIVQQMLVDDIEQTPCVEMLVNETVPVRTQPTGLFSMIHLKLRALKRRFFLNRDIKLIQGTGFFDTTWYLERNPDVKQSQIEPVRHFLLFGGFEGRDPSEKFSSEWYLGVYDDVRKSGVNPLVHYLKFGISEKRIPKKTA